MPASGVDKLEFIPIIFQTFKFEFPAACRNEAKIPHTGVGAKRKSRLSGQRWKIQMKDKIVTRFYLNHGNRRSYGHQ